MRKPLPCLCCNGEGRDYLWKDRDPIEGYKMAPRYTCFFCEGKKEIQPDDPRYEAVKSYYTTFKRMATVEEQKKKRERQEKEAAIKKALAKLNMNDRIALGLRIK